MLVYDFFLIYFFVFLSSSVIYLLLYYTTILQGDIILWNIQHDDGENIICKINAHEELVTHMAWINDMDIAKTPLLATSSLDGCLNLWNFDPADAIIKLKHK